MTNKEEIRNIIELFIAWNGETKVIDISNIDSAVDFINDSLQEEPISEELEEAAKNHAVERFRTTRDRELAEKCKWSFKAGAQWQKARIIIKVCKWFNDNVCNYFGHMPVYPFIDDLKQSMKDE